MKRRHLVGEIEKRDRGGREVLRLFSGPDDGDAASPARRHASADATARDPHLHQQSSVGRAAREAPADLGLVAEQPTKPRDIEIHQTGASLFHPRRMGKRHLEEFALALPGSLEGEETGEASQSRHSISQPSVNSAPASVSRSWVLSTSRRLEEDDGQGAYHGRDEQNRARVAVQRRDAAVSSPARAATGAECQAARHARRIARLTPLCVSSGAVIW